MAQPFQKTVWQFLVKLNTCLLCDPEILEHIYIYILKKKKTYVHTKTCTQLFTAALSIPSQTRNNQISINM